MSVFLFSRLRLQLSGDVGGGLFLGGYFREFRDRGFFFRYSDIGTIQIKAWAATFNETRMQHSSGGGSKGKKFESANKKVRWQWSYAPL
jgi:hypothetical protein